MPSYKAHEDTVVKHLIPIVVELKKMLDQIPENDRQAILGAVYSIVFHHTIFDHVRTHHDDKLSGRLCAAMGIEEEYKFLLNNFTNFALELNNTEKPLPDWGKILNTYISRIEWETGQKIDLGAPFEETDSNDSRAT